MGTHLVSNVLRNKEVGALSCSYHIRGWGGILCAKKEIRGIHLLRGSEAIEDDEGGEGETIVLKVSKVNKEPHLEMNLEWISAGESR